MDTVRLPERLAKGGGSATWDNPQKLFTIILLAVIFSNQTNNDKIFLINDGTKFDPIALKNIIS